jgi:hypothetical protein
MCRAAPSKRGSLCERPFSRPFYHFMAGTSNATPLLACRSGKEGARHVHFLFFFFLESAGSRASPLLVVPPRGLPNGTIAKPFAVFDKQTTPPVACLWMYLVGAGRLFAITASAFNLARRSILPVLLRRMCCYGRICQCQDGGQSPERALRAQQPDNLIGQARAAISRSSPASHLCRKKNGYLFE